MFQNSANAAERSLVIGGGISELDLASLMAAEAFALRSQPDARHLLVPITLYPLTLCVFEQ